ncbi:unnamed protein product [Ectocarpus sp. 12 AP-2014]
MIRKVDLRDGTHKSRYPSGRVIQHDSTHERTQPANTRIICWGSPNGPAIWLTLGLLAIYDTHKSASARTGHPHQPCLVVVDERGGQSLENPRLQQNINIF